MHGKVFISVYACWDGDPLALRGTPSCQVVNARRLRLKTVVRVRRCPDRGDLHCVDGKLHLTFGRQVTGVLCTVKVARGRSSARA